LLGGNKIGTEIDRDEDD